MSVLESLKEELKEGVLENEPLSRHTTFGLGGPARYFYPAQTLSDLMKAIKLALKLNLPFFVLGNGSNVLVADQGFSGLCIKNEARNISIIAQKSQVIADSGVFLSKMVAEAASYDLGGLEFLYGIPGTVGGAVVSNAGVMGASIGDFLISATLFFPSGEIKRLTKRWFEFGYRESRLRHLHPKPIVLSVKLQFASNRREEILRKIQHFQKIRSAKQPNERSAGSFFKNPQVDSAWAEKYLRMSGISDGEILETIRKTGHIPAGWLLEQVGAKTMKVKAARVSKKHANFLINYKGKATASQIRQLAEQLKKRVYERFGIVLEEEIEYLGDWE
jgi:UDP-N-acetylmuramate dehydrogenase